MDIKIISSNTFNGLRTNPKFTNKIAHDACEYCAGKKYCQKDKLETNPCADSEIVEMIHYPFKGEKLQDSAVFYPPYYAVVDECKPYPRIYPIKGYDAAEFMNNLVKVKVGRQLPFTKKQFDRFAEYSSYNRPVNKINKEIETIISAIGEEDLKVTGVERTMDELEVINPQKKKNK